MNNATSAELGSLQGKEHNRYWQIKTGGSGFLSGEKNPVNRICWYLLTLVMVGPLVLAAWFYRLRRSAGERGKPVTVPYGLFTDIYPGCVYSPLAKSLELELFGAVPVDAPALEIGIGDGYFSSLLSGARGKRLAYGADLAFEMLKRSRQYGHCECYMIMDALEIPLPDNSLGTIIMNNLMHHLPDRKSALKELMRVLKKGGRLIFTDNTVGWGLYTWEQLALRKVRLGRLADKVMTFKLRLFAQNLLCDESYYERLAGELGYQVNEKTGFISRRSMYLSSLFEFLNLKQGQPTRHQMRRWISLFKLEKTLRKYMAEIIEDCCLRDAASDGKEAAFQFLVLEKTTGNAGPSRSPEFVCPRCKITLAQDNDRYSCSSCAADYPVIDGIPVFLSYKEQLKGFEKYLLKKRVQQVSDYMT